MDYFLPTTLPIIRNNFRESFLFNSSSALSGTFSHKGRRPLITDTGNSSLLHLWEKVAAKLTDEGYSFLKLAHILLILPLTCKRNFGSAWLARIHSPYKGEDWDGGTQ